MSASAAVQERSSDAVDAGAMVGMPVGTASTIAREFMRIAKRQGQTLTPMQIVKLVYIAHGWALAVLDRPLISDKIEAWRYGPVIPSLYDETKRFGPGPMPMDDIDEKQKSRLDEDVQAFMENVFEQYGRLPEEELGRLASLPGSPWRIAHKKGVDAEIPNYTIHGYHLEKLRKSQKRNGK